MVLNLSKGDQSGVSNQRFMVNSTGGAKGRRNCAPAFEDMEIVKQALPH
jgi:hypothetical protein